MPGDVKSSAHATRAPIAGTFLNELFSLSPFLSSNPGIVKALPPRISSTTSLVSAETSNFQFYYGQQMAAKLKSLTRPSHLAHRYQ